MLITLNENQLMRIVENTVKKVLNEGKFYMDANNPEEFGFLWDELASDYTTNNSQANDTVFCEVGFFAVNKMCEKNGKSFGENAKKMADKYFTNAEFNQTFNKIVNKVRLQRM